MKLFWRIFLAFLAATVLTNAFVVFLNEYLQIRFNNARRQPFAPRAAEDAFRTAASLYEAQGSSAFLSSLRQSLPAFGPVFLFDSQGQPLAHDAPLRPALPNLARRVAASGHCELVRRGLRDLFVCPVQSASGRRYAVILTVYQAVRRFARPRYWLNLALALLPIGLVCALLSIYITRPITGLQKTTHRIAGGDFEARSSPRLSSRSDEFGGLARDFDAMSSRISILMSAQRRFVADVSHELGGPLTRMHLALALLKRKSSGADREIERIEGETRHLSELVQQLLTLATLEAGKLPSETLATLPLRDLTEDLLHDAAFEAARRNCRIVEQLEDITVTVYPRLLRRALENILRNAIRYAPDGSDILFTTRVAGNRRRVTIEIADSGPGVPEAMLTDIFRPFFRTAPGRERENGGAGLGLAIASDAIQLHEGSLTAHNRPGGGLSVIVNLPVGGKLPSAMQPPHLS